MMERRFFLQHSLAMAAGGLMIALAALPGIIHLLSPLRGGSKNPDEWHNLGDVSDYPENMAVMKTLRLRKQDGWQARETEQRVFVTRNGDRFKVFSSVCPHLKCPVSLPSDGNQFHCACHQSYWSLDGERISGPTPRGLDELPSRIEGETLLCRWALYQPGGPVKVEI